MTVMQEGDSIPQDVMDIILMHIIQPYKSRKPAAHRLAKELINKSATYMEPNIQKFFNAALMKGIETDSGKKLEKSNIIICLACVIKIGQIG